MPLSESVVVLASTIALSAATADAIRGQTCHDQWPAWSPSGEEVVFVSTRTGDHEIFLLSLVDGAVTQLTDTPGRDAHPAFSPDGGRIAFQSPRSEGHTNLFVMNADGSEQRQVTHHQGFLGMPVWSPDGKRLAYQWRSGTEGGRWQVMMLNLADGTTRAITDGAAHDQVVNWSPDGSGVVFHSDRTGQNQIYRWQNGVTTRVTHTEFEDKSASWSPDATKLSFVSSRAPNGAGIYVMDADGSKVRRVGDVSIEHSLPFFSPDGQQLLVTPTTSSGTEVWTLDVLSGTASRLSRCVPK